jgi:hypothetical protein
MKRREGIGPYSSDASLAAIDGRTRLGKQLSELRAALSEHVGGAPTPTQQIVIESLAIKTLRCRLAAARVIQNPESDSHQVLAWLNGAERAAALLGLEAEAAEPLSLAQYIEQKGKAS